MSVEKVKSEKSERETEVLVPPLPRQGHSVERTIDVLAGAILAPDEARAERDRLAERYTKLHRAQRERVARRQQVDRKLSERSAEVTRKLGEAVELGESLPSIDAAMLNNAELAGLRNELEHLDKLTLAGKKALRRAEADYHAHIVRYWEVFIGDELSATDEIEANLRKIKAQYEAAYGQWNEAAGRIERLIGHSNRGNNATTGSTLPWQHAADEELPDLAVKCERLPVPAAIFNVRLAPSGLDGLMVKRAEVREWRKAEAELDPADAAPPDVQAQARMWEAAGEPPVSPWKQRARERAASKGA